MFMGKRFSKEQGLNRERGRVAKFIGRKFISICIIIIQLVVPRLMRVASYTSTPPYVFMTWCLVKHRIRPNGLYLGSGRTLPYRDLRSAEL